MSVVGPTCPTCEHKDCPQRGQTNKSVAAAWLVAAPAWIIFSAGAFAIFGRVVGAIMTLGAGAFALWILSRWNDDTYACPSCGKHFYVPLV